MYGRQSRVEIKHYITGGENVWAAVTGRNQTLLEERMYGRQSRVEIKHYITGGENV